MKFNVDGASNEHLRTNVCGWVLRDSEGCVKGDFQFNIVRAAWRCGQFILWVEESFEDEYG